MPRPHPRRDGYGRPLPPLADAHQEVLLERPVNQAMRRFIARLLDEQFVDVCRRGVYARVEVCFEVRDGILESELTQVKVARLVRPPP